MFRSSVFVLMLVFSFIISSCGNELKQEDNRNVKLLTNSADLSSSVIESDNNASSGITCDRSIYGDECSHPENFVLVKKEEVKPEYIKAGTSIGGVNGSIVEGSTEYSECSSDGQLDCLATQTYKAVNLSNHTSKIVSSENIFGVFGNYVIPSSNEILTGTTYGPNNSLPGSLAYCDSESYTSSCYVKTYSGESGYTLKALDYDEIASKTAYIENNYVLVSDITGAQSVCGNGSTNCYINGNTLKAVVSDDLIASNIKNGESIGGVDGSYTYMGDDIDCDGSSPTGCVANSSYPSVPATLTSYLLSTASINSVNGSITSCTAGSGSCYTGDSFKAVDSSELVASNIKNGVSLGEVTGTYPSDTSPLNGANATQDLKGINFNNLMVNNNNFEWFDSSGNRYTRAGDTNIVASNIRKGETIFGVEGTYGEYLRPNAAGNGYYSYTSAITYLKSDGSITCFGSNYHGGKCYYYQNDIQKVFGGEMVLAALGIDGSLVTWDDYGISSIQIPSGVRKIFPIQYGSLVALKENGTIFIDGVLKEDVENVVDIIPNAGFYYNAVAALTSTGKVVTWGDSLYGGGSVLESGVTKVVAAPGYNEGAFAALKSDGTVVAWGEANFGGNISSEIQSQLTNVINIFSSTEYYEPGGKGAFAALKSDGTVVTWGGEDCAAADSSSVKSDLVDVVNIFSTRGAFAALKSDGTIVVWGNASYGGSLTVSAETQLEGEEVVNIFSTRSAFAALTSDGDVITWGNAAEGGGGGSIGNVKKISSTEKAFAALKEDGTIVAWGDGDFGGDIASVVAPVGTPVSGKFMDIVSSQTMFIGIREDESYVVWGEQ